MNTPQYNRNGIRIDTDRPHIDKRYKRSGHNTFASRMNARIERQEKIENMIDPRPKKSRKSTQ